MDSWQKEALERAWDKVYSGDTLTPEEELAIDEHMREIDNYYPMYPHS